MGVRVMWFGGGTVALALLFAGGVMTGDAYLFDRLGGFSGGVLLDEPLLPASSLTRNTRNTRNMNGVASGSWSDGVYAIVKTEDWSAALLSVVSADLETK